METSSCRCCAWLEENEEAQPVTPPPSSPRCREIGEAAAVLASQHTGSDGGGRGEGKQGRNGTLARPRPRRALPLPCARLYLAPALLVLRRSASREGAAGGGRDQGVVLLVTVVDAVDERGVVLLMDGAGLWPGAVTNSGLEEEKKVLTHTAAAEASGAVHAPGPLLFFYSALDNSR